MAKKRDHRAEYARRIARGKKRGLSRSQARGHARPGEEPVRGHKLSQNDVRLETALKAMRRTGTQVAAAKQAGVSAERLRRFLYENKLATRQGNQWQFSDDRIREMSVLSEGQMRRMRLRGFDEASLNGEYLSAVGQFIIKNDPEYLADFVGQSVRDAKGKSHPFETDPNELYRLYHSGDEPFEVYYKLLSFPT